MPSASSRMAYVLLWAVEEDLRNLIQLYAEGAAAVAILGPSLTERATKRRQQDKRASAEHLAGLLPYIDFQDAFDIVMRIKDQLPDDLAKRMQTLSECLINGPMSPWSRGGAGLVPWLVC